MEVISTAEPPLAASVLVMSAATCSTDIPEDWIACPC